jgi:hypothetical protein
MKVGVAALVVVVGLLLVATGIVLYVSARERQSEEQARLDRHWSEVNRKAAQQVPRTLPGEERPTPAPLRGMAWVVGLCGAGAVLAVAGLATILLRRRGSGGVTAGEEWRSRPRP